MPGKIQLHKNISMTTYRFIPTLRNKILNSKETVQSIIVDGEIPFSSAGTCDCEK